MAACSKHSDTHPQSGGFSSAVVLTCVLHVGVVREVGGILARLCEVNNARSEEGVMEWSHTRDIGSEGIIHE